MNFPLEGQVDPQAQAILDARGRAPRNNNRVDDARFVASMRSGYINFSAAKNCPAGPPEAVKHFENIYIDGAEGPLAARLYRSLGDEKDPLLVWFHGGGYIAGDLETHDRPLRALANRCRGTILSVEYRLAPEHPYPAAAEDAYAAIVWAARRAEGLGADPKRIVIGGDSAGGTHAIVATTLARERGGPVIALQILLYPGTDFRAGIDYPSWKENDGRILARQDAERMISFYIPPDADRADPHISPVAAKPEDLRGLPPALVITGECDPLRDEGEAYAARLMEAGVTVQLTRYPGMIHGFFQMAAKLDAGVEVIEQIAKAVGQAPRAP